MAYLTFLKIYVIILKKTIAAARSARMTRGAAPYTHSIYYNIFFYKNQLCIFTWDKNKFSQGIRLAPN